MRAMAPGGGASVTRWTMPTAWPASPSSSASRGAWSLARTTRAFSADPVLDAVDEALRASGREHRFAPAELVAAGQALRGERHALGRAGLGLPRELERPRAVEVALPVAWRQVGGRPVLRQVAGLDHLRVPLLGLAPQEVGGVGEVAGLVEDEEGRRVEVVEAGLRRDDASPDLGGVAGGQGPALDGLGARGGVAGEALEVLGEAVGQAGRHPAEPLPDHARAAGRQQELGRRAGGRPRGRRRYCVGRWGRRRAGSRSRRRTARSGPGGAPTAGTRRRFRRVARTRPGRRPRSRACSRARTARAISGSRPIRTPGLRVRMSDGQVVGRDRRLDAAPGRWRRGPSRRQIATRPAPRPGRRSRRARARCARRPATSWARGSRPAPCRRARRPAPRPRGRRSRRRGPPSRSAPRRARGRGPRRGRTSPRAGTDVSPTCLPCWPGASPACPSRSRSEPNAPVSWSSFGRTARSGTRRPAPRDDDPVLSWPRAAAGRLGRAAVATPPWSRSGGRPGRAARPRPRPRPSRGRAPARWPAWRPAAPPTRGRPSPRRSAGGSSVRGTDRPSSLAALRARSPRPFLAGVVGAAREDLPPAGLRPPDALVVGRSAHLARLRPLAVAVGVGRRLELEAVPPVGRLRRAFLGPGLDGVGRGVEQDRQPRPLVDAERRQDVVDRPSRRVPDADP